MKAAVAVFGREGVRHTSMLAIAQEAGVASGTIYQYFADKEDVFRYLLNELEHEFERELAWRTDDDGAAQIQDVVRRYLELHRRNVAIYRAWWDLLEPRTEFTETWRATHNRFRKRLARVIKAGQRNAGASGDVDANAAAELLVLMLERVAYSRNIMGWDEELTDEEVADLMGDLFGSDRG